MNKNSKYFHSRATQRHRKNSILKIQNSSRQWFTNSDDIATVVLGYYLNLFSSEPIQQPEDILRSILGIINVDMNNQLSLHFMAWEVQDAI